MVENNHFNSFFYLMINFQLTLFLLQIILTDTDNKRYQLLLSGKILNKNVKNHEKNTITTITTINTKFTLTEKVFQQIKKYRKHRNIPCKPKDAQKIMQIEIMFGLLKIDKLFKTNDNSVS
ncbi:hypothetical protein M153_2220005490 [Pseudoloma neurophilia]|uniref:Uncharacterized protein n=1 Tax=Pseudoloma neurophilia TaxID=146866 RepID=A0A0R0M529_9MICR|nr:hypothetical protein M153_2220005490 [Pseudoloma neurophilia]